MAGYGAPLGLGALAQGFAEGYRQARGQREAEMQNQREMMYQHGDRLTKIADMMLDPGLRNTAMQQALSMYDQADQLGRTGSGSKKGGGLGSMIRGLFGGGGGQQQAPDTGGGPSSAGAGEPSSPGPTGAQSPMAAAAPTATPTLAPVEAGSQTFGDNLGAMFGQATRLNQESTMPPRPQAMTPQQSIQGMQAPPALPQPPAVLQPPAAGAVGPVGAPVAQTAPAPQVGGGPQGVWAGSHTLPTGSDIRQQVMQEYSQGSPYGVSTAQRGFMPLRESQLAEQYANIQLQAVDKMLEAHPEITTLTQAYHQLGPEFAHVMQTVGQYENSTRMDGRPLLEKGTLENWQKRFDDVRLGTAKFGESRFVKLDDGTVGYNDPVSFQFKVVGTPDEAYRYKNGLMKPAEQADYLNRTQNFKEADTVPDIAKRTFDYLTTPAAQGGRGMDAASAYQFMEAQKRSPQEHEPHLAVVPRSDGSGQDEYVMISADGKTSTPTGIRARSGFNILSLQKPRTVSTPIIPNDPHSPMTTETKMSYDPTAVITAYRRGDIGDPELNLIMQQAKGSNPTQVNDPDLYNQLQAFQKNPRPF